MVIKGFDMDYAWLIIFSCSVMQALCSTILSLGIAVPLAHFFYRFNFFGKHFWLSLVPLLCIMPTKLVGLAISKFYGLQGFFGIILGHGMLNIPFCFYLLQGTYAKFDHRWDLVAQQHGASPWQCYSDIYLPFLRPTIIAAASIIFVLCFSSVALPMVLGVAMHHMTPDVTIANLYHTDDWYGAGFFFVIRLLVVLPISMVETHGAKSAWLSHDSMAYASVQYKPRKHGYGWLLLCLTAVVLTIGPLCALLVAMANGAVANFLRQIFVGDVDLILGVPVYRVIFNSLFLALVSSGGAVIVGLVLCEIMQRVQHSTSKKLVALCTMLPCLVGSVGCGIFFVWIARAPVLSMAMVAVLCHMVLNYPFTYRIVKAHMVGWQSEWELTARSFGATRLQRWQTLELPFLRGALWQAFYIAFGLSLTEVGAGSVLGGAAGITLPMAIKIYREHGVMDGVMGLSFVVLFVGTVGGLLVIRMG
ncbi:MAG: ABC transporter permease subunit [Candidatus Dependentiae bacterium]|nr:ABC transporter permease subunit [Candidatus Dependentiae bacterium]